MNTKFEELSLRTETIDKKADAAESLAKENQNNISNLTYESIALQEKLAEPAIHELEENIDDQVNGHFGDALVKRGTKKENQEKKWNNTSHVLSQVLFVDCLGGI